MAKVFQVDTGGTLLTSLVSYFKMDDINDAVGANHLTNYNTVTFGASAINGNCAIFNGSNNYLRRANPLSTATTNISMFMWIYLSSTVEKGGFFSNGGYTGSAWNGYALGVGDNTDSMDFTGNYLVGLAHGVLAKTFGSIGGSGWRFVGMTRDATTWRGYCDNNLLGATFTASPNTPMNHVTFGAANLDYAPYPRYSNAKVDEMGFWNKVLSTQERTDLWNGGAGQTMVDPATTPLPILMSQFRRRWSA
jgi:hypothetical protein